MKNGVYDLVEEGQGWSAVILRVSHVGWERFGLIFYSWIGLSLI